MTIRSRISQHINEHKELYTHIAVGASVAGITALIMRGIASQPINSGITGVADHGFTVIGKKVVMRNVSYISVDRQGPPSWVVRCIETGNFFGSQRTAEMEMGLTTGNVSKQINGVLEHANGFHFERICMAA